MSELSNKIRALRAEMTGEEAAAKTGLSRESFYRIERGGTIKLSTLRQIANGFGLSTPEWCDLLVAWLKSEAGEDGRLIWIEPKDGGALHDAEASQTAQALSLFERLNPSDRKEILFAMERPEVRACLPAINRIWEKIDHQQKNSTSKS